MSVLLVTVDTNQLDAIKIRRVRAALSCPHELACVTVTARERGGDSESSAMTLIPETLVWGESRWGEAVWGRSIPEAFVVGESPLGLAALTSDEGASVYEQALQIISNGSFPSRSSGGRESLTPGQRRQMRDAMIFEAHVRARRHVLVTDDAKGFIEGGRRELLERLGRTRILTLAELEALATAGQLADLVP